MQKRTFSKPWGRFNVPVSGFRCDIKLSGLSNISQSTITMQAIATSQSVVDIYRSLAAVLNLVNDWTADDVWGDIDDLPAYGQLRKLSGEFAKVLNSLGDIDTDDSSSDGSDEDDLVGDVYFGGSLMNLIT